MAPLLRSRSTILLVCLLGGLAASITITILTIALPPIADDFAASVTDAAWVLLAPIVVSALVGPASGRAADMFGRRRMWTLGFTIATVGVIACAGAPSLAVLIIGRIVTGVGTALALPAGLAIATAEYRPRERGIPLGWWTSTTALAPAAGVLIGGLVVEHLSWRWLFYGQIPLVLAALVLGRALFPESRPDSSGRFDLAGAVVGGATVFAFLLAVNRGSVWGWTSPAILTCLVATAGGMPAFLWIERRAERPVFPLEILRQPVIRWAVVNRAALHGAYLGSFIVLPVMLMEVGSWAPAAVALALAPRPIAMGISGPVAGNLTSRRDPARITLFGSLSLMLGVSVLVGIRPDLPYVILLAALVAMGLGFGVSGTAAGALITARVDADELGTVSGFLAIVGSMANALGMAVMLAVVAAAGGEHSQSAFQWSFMVGTALAVLGAGSAVALVRAARSVPREKP